MNSELRFNMDDQFFYHIFDKHQQVDAVPSNKEITSWALEVIRLLFPEQQRQDFFDVQQVKDEFIRLEQELAFIMNSTRACKDCDNELLARLFFEQVPELFRLLNTDIQAIFNGDPAARSEFEVIRTYPGFFAICFYRLAHSLYMHEIPLVRALSWGKAAISANM